MDKDIPLPVLTEKDLLHVTMPEVDLLGDPDAIPASELELTTDCIRAIRDSLWLLESKPCAFKHHYTWNNNGKDLPLCEAAERDSNLLCAHSRGPKQILNRAVGFLVHHGLMSEEAAENCSAIIEGSDLFHADIVTALTAKVAWANSFGSDIPPAPWIGERLRELGVTIPPQAITKTGVRQAAQDLQTEAGEPRKMLLSILASAFEALSAEPDQFQSKKAKIEQFLKDGLAMIESHYSQERNG